MEISSVILREVTSRQTNDVLGGKECHTILCVHCRWVFSKPCFAFLVGFQILCANYPGRHSSNWAVETTIIIVCSITWISAHCYWGMHHFPGTKWETWSPPRVSIPPHHWLHVTFVSGIIVCMTDRVTCHPGDIWLTCHPIISDCWIALYATAITVITWAYSHGVQRSQVNAHCYNIKQICSIELYILLAAALTGWD